jgi:hypothetical protein
MAVTTGWRARIDIKDNGLGLPAQLQDTLFYPIVSGRKGANGLVDYQSPVILSINILEKLNLIVSTVIPNSLST